MTMLMAQCIFQISHGGGVSLSDIKNYSSDIVAIYSNNDPYVKFEVEKEFADAVTTNQIIVENGGHLNTSFGYSKFGLLLKFVD